jgi:hypothetical protein
MPASDIRRAVLDACVEQLEARGMQRSTRGRLERQLSPGITGFVTPSVDAKAAGPSGFPVVVDPTVGVRHYVASRLASKFLGLKPDAHTQPSFLLTNLVPDASFPPRWLVADEDCVEDVARLLAEDVVFNAYPWFESMSSISGLIDKLANSPWQIHGAYILAVLYMLDGGRLDDARQALMRRSLPVSQDPPRWANSQFAGYLDAFAAYFDVDLETQRWPVRQPRKPSETIFKIRDEGVIRNGLAIAGRPDLADRVSELTAEEIDQIAMRGGALLQRGAEQHLGKAFGLVAAELLDAKTPGADAAP